MESVLLTGWQHLALEAGLRKLAASGEVDRDSLQELQRLLETSTTIQVTYEPE